MRIGPSPCKGENAGGSFVLERGGRERFELDIAEFVL